jgi:hypothetical protein
MPPSNRLKPFRYLKSIWLPNVTWYGALPFSGFTTEWDAIDVDVSETA